MALFTLATSDSLLIDHIAGGAVDYRSGLLLDFNSATGTLSGSLLDNGTALEQTNLVHTFDGDKSTTGVLPKLRLQLADFLPSGDFTLGWKLTSGLDGSRASGEKQVSLSGLKVHLGLKDGKTLIYAQQQTIKIQAYRSSSDDPLQQYVTFSPSDVIGEVLVEDGKIFLDLNFMAVVAKLDSWFTPGSSMANLLALWKYTPYSLLSAGNYHLDITGLPLASSEGEVKTLSLVMPIAASANQAPQINGSVGELTLTEDELQILDLPAAVDPEDNPITWTASTSDSRVAASIEKGKLKLAPAENYNTTTPIVVTLKASDPALAWNTTSFAVTVAAVNDAPTGSLTIIGTATRGQTLEVSSSNLVDAEEFVNFVSYQWLADGKLIDGATNSTLTLTDKEVGKKISVHVTYLDGGGTLESIDSGVTAAVTSVNSTPGGSVTISGTVRQGETLEAIEDIVDAVGLGEISWQWLADGGRGAQPIDGETGQELLLTQALVGKTISVEVSYTDGLGTFERVPSLATAAVVNVNDAPSGAVTIGGTAREGQKLTASPNIADIDGMRAISWQWLADGVAIVGATGARLTLSKAQVGKAISVRASYTDGGGTLESVLSSATAAVASAVSKAPVSVATAGNDSLIGTSAAETIDGLAGNDTIAGLEGDDVLYGSSGNDVLDGGAGKDRLYGGAGNDTYVIDSIEDEVVEVFKAGTDLVKVADISAGATYVLPENVENAILINPVAYNLTGNELANLLTGNDFANELDGGEDLLADTLVGGGGDDTYIVRLSAAGSLQDKITETSKTDSGDMLQLGGELKTSKLVTLTLSGSLANLEHLDASRITWSDSAPNSPASRKLNLTGNAAANRLTGDDADNVLSGLAGADTLCGGAGNDTYVVDDRGDVVQEESGSEGGIDIVLSSISFSLANEDGGNQLAAVENLTLTGKGKIDGSGNALANKLTGNAAANALSGGAGDDTLIGGAGNDTLDGGEGLDSLEGGAGDDTYIVDLTDLGELEDTVVEVARGGTDTLRLRGTLGNAVKVALSGGLANVEHLDASLTGSRMLDLTGNAAANVLTGNDAANTLEGGAGNDTLIGGGGGDRLVGGEGNDSLDGGEGNDTLFGGPGNDTYVIDSLLDEVREEDKQGVDLVQVALATAGDTYVLAANVENATLSNKLACHLTGNAAANVLTGNEAANHLAGGDGNDTLIGGAGNDTLEGGAGGDALTGGVGDDTYIVQLTAKGALEDKITETSTTDTGDTLQVSGQLTTQTVSLALSGSLARIEHLDASGVKWSESAAGTPAQRKLNLTGNAAANTLTGNDADNVLAGLAGADRLVGGKGNDTLNGGAGDDVLVGGEGSDVFVFNAALSGKSGSNVDHIEDFVSGTDRIFLDDAVFTKIGVKGTSAGTALRADSFCLGSEAKDAADRIIYDQTSGNLYYDPTGSVNGANDQVLFAVIVNPTALSQGDFFIV